MHEDTLAQARELFYTVGLLKRKIAHQFSDCLKNRPDGMPCVEMTFPQSNAMLAIQERGALSIKELAEALHVSPPSASAMVDRLVEMNMLVREQSREDRREVRIRVSELGGTCLAEVENKILAAIVDLLEKLGPEVSQQWCGIYARIRAILEAEDDAACSGDHIKEREV